MFGVEDGKQMRDYYYYPINPPPLPVTIPTTRKDMGDSKEFIYFRREDTGEHFQDVIVKCPSYNKFQLLVNTESSNYSKEKWDWKGSMVIQLRKNCDLYPKGSEPGPDLVESSAKQLLSFGSIGIALLALSQIF